MSKSLKIILYAVGGFVGLLAFVAMALLFFVDANAYKSRLEAATSEVLGMEVRVGGRMGIAFFPGLLVTLEDMRIRNRGTDFASAKEAGLGIYLFPLLQKKVRIGSIALKHSRISIERGRDGKFNFEKPEEAAGGMLPALDLAKVSLSDGTFLYADKQSGEGFEAGDCSLDVHPLRLSSGKRSDFMKNLSFTAELACREIRTKDFTASDLKISVAGKDGVFDLKPVLMRAFGGQGSGSIRADFAADVPLYHIRYSLSQFHIKEFLKTLSPNKIAEGSMDLSANLSMQGKTAKEMTRTAHGEVSLRGKELMLDGIDLDRNLSRFESSQNFNLVDVGAFFFAGPFGLVVTKGYNFASIFQGSGGRSEIRTIVSAWKVELGTAQAQDVAMATNDNRIALQGKLDFVNERFNDVTMAVIDAKGCASVRQKILGTFQKPVVEKPSFLKSLTGPAFNLLKKGRKLFPGGACEVFYAGSVAPPK
ncbi:MAG TPA: AsmA family protein [Nitrospiria bacterium]|nr:AsmA family protein [Nitrospiria bacterium]